MQTKFKYSVLCGVLLCFSACLQANDKQSDYPIQQVNLNQVTLTDSFWLSKIRTIQEKTIRYAFDKCTSEGRLENFVTAAEVIRGGTGKTRGAMPFDDTDVYKTIEGAAYSLINAPNSALSAYLDSIIEIVRGGQEPDGYLTTWRTINPKNPPASWVKTNGERWNGLDMSHELYNSGHLFEAAAAHHRATGKRNFLDVALKNADLLVKVFGDTANREVPGHQIVETGLIKLYQISGKKEYLHLAKKFLDLRGDKQRRRIRGDYSQDHLPVTQQTEAVGHAVRAVYMYAGMTDIAALYGDSAYLNAVNRLWENMTGKKMYLTGGLGARHAGEAFGDNYELPNLTAYSETCAAIGGVYWNERLFRLTGDAKYYDVLERMLYNAVISGISLGGTEFFYPNPLEADGKYCFNHGACTRQAWFDCSCCPTNLIRFIPYIPNLIYAVQKDTVYINLFVSNRAAIPVEKETVEIVQETAYPWNGNISIDIKTDKPLPFTLKIRLPAWAQNKIQAGELYTYANDAGEPYRVLLNGQPVTETKRDDGYLAITANWNAGDRIELQFPMTVRQVAANANVKDDAGKMAIEYGPLVYCMEEADNPATFDNHGMATEYSVEWKPELLGGVNIIRERSNGGEQVLIPYYAWSNRGVGKMKVWQAQDKSAGHSPVNLSRNVAYRVSTTSPNSNYRLVWADEFDRDGKPDPAVWSYENGFVRNREFQWYQPDNANCRKGILTIEAKREQIPNPHYTAGSNDWRKDRPFAEYTSACIKTVGKKEFLYGRFEVRAKIPVASGSWPAIWTLGKSMPWPSCGEIDVMEYYQIKGVPHILANTAWGKDKPYDAQWDTQTVPFSHFTDKDPAWADKFHIWRMDWDEEAIRLYLDDELLNETLLRDTQNGAVGNYSNPFKQPHYLLLNLAIGGQNGGTPDDAAFPLKYEIDYVRVYQKQPDTAEQPENIIAVIEKVNDYWQSTHPEPGNAFWHVAAYHTGNMAAYEATGKAAYRSYSEKWADANEWKGAKSDRKQKWKYTYGETDEYVLFGDWQICFQTYIDLYQLSPDERKIRRAEEVMEYQMSTPNSDYWWWADGLYMVMPVMTKLYKTTGNELYLQKLYEYFSYAKNLMYDEESGLFFRDAKYVYPKHKTQSGLKDFWSRGNGWVFAGLAKVLQDLPENDIHRDEYIQMFRSMTTALIAAQQPEGHWTRSLLDADHAPGYETSGTAFFAYGLAWGVNNGILDRETCRPTLEKAWKYLTNVALQADGKVGYVQPIGERADQHDVSADTTADFGVGAFLLAAVEMKQYLSDRIYWTSLAYKIAAPVLENMSKGELAKNMQVEVSPTWDGRDKKVTYMECFGRLMDGIAPWLSLPDDETSEGKQRKQLREWALKSYAHAVDPQSPDYLLWRNEGQPLVDAAYIASSFLRAPQQLWQPLDEQTRKRYIAEFQQLRRIDPPYTNWLLFSATIETFLLSVDAQYDMYRIHSALRKVEEWYVGDGWYSDGEHFAFDYYNSYVIQPMYTQVLQVLADKKIHLRDKSSDYAAKTLDIALKRMQRYGIILERFISPEGSFPTFGRSMTYRLGAFQPLALLAWKENLPKELSAGQVRNALTQVMKRMFSVEGNFNESGFLQLGFAGHQPELADWYTNNGSMYLTSEVFLPLGLPANHPFWTAPAQDWTQKKAWNGKPFPKDHAH